MTVDELKRSFDQAFALPLSNQVTEYEKLILIQVAGNAFALLLNEIVSIEVDRKIVPLPAQGPPLLGLSGIQNKLIPIFDLNVLLGYSREDRSTKRWIAVCGKPEPIGLAFDLLEGQIRIPTGEWLAAKASTDHGHSVKFTQGALQKDSKTFYVLDLPAIIQNVSKKEK